MKRFASALFLFGILVSLSTVRAELNLPDNLTQIAESAFEGDTQVSGSLRTGGVTGIGARAFAGTSLFSADLEHVVTVGEDAFSDVDGLAFVRLRGETVSAGEGAFSAARYLFGANPSEASSWVGPDTLVVPPEDLCEAGGFYYVLSGEGTERAATLTAATCMREQQTVIIPDRVRGVPVTAMAEGALDGLAYGTGIERLSLPQGMAVSAEQLDALRAQFFYLSLDENSIVVRRPVSEADFEVEPLDGGACRITAYKGDGGIVDIPETIGGRTVTEIGTRAFAVNDTLFSVSIPDTVERIGDDAFSWCGMLTSVRLPAGLTELGSCFGGCVSLEDAALPATLRSIACGAFDGCTALSEAELPEGLAFLGGGAFASTALTSVTLPASLARISDENGILNPFWQCEKLASIRIAEGNTAFRLEGALLLSADGKTLIAYPAACPEETCVIPASVTDIPDAMPFYGAAHLKELVLEGSVYPDMEGCPSLEAYRVTHPTASLYDVDGVLYGLHRKEPVLISIPQQYRADTFVVPPEIRKIPRAAFRETRGIRRVVIPKTVSEVKGYNFAQSTVEEVVFEGSFTINGGNLFDGCASLRSVTLPKPMKRYGANSKPVIEDGSFSGCAALTEFDMPAGVREIGMEAFYGCSSLDRVSLPEGLRTICGLAFQECKRLREFSLPGTLQEIGSSAFEYALGPEELVIPASLQVMGDRAFYGCAGISRVVWNSTADVPYSAFESCDSLRSVTLADGVSTIEAYAFAGDDLTEAVIPASVTEIGEYAFNNAEGDTPGESRLLIRGKAGSAAETYALQNCIRFEAIP